MLYSNFESTFLLSLNKPTYNLYILSICCLGKCKNDVVVVVGEKVCVSKRQSENVSDMRDNSLWMGESI